MTREQFINTQNKYEEKIKRKKEKEQLVREKMQAKETKGAIKYFTKKIESGYDCNHKFIYYPIADVVKYGYPHKKQILEALENKFDFLKFELSCSNLSLYQDGFYLKLNVSLKTEEEQEVKVILHF